MVVFKDLFLTLTERSQVALQVSYKIEFMFPYAPRERLEYHIIPVIYSLITATVFHPC